MITAVTIVPALCRLMLRSAKYRRWTAFAAGIGLAGFIGISSTLHVGEHELQNTLKSFASIITGIAVPHWSASFVAVGS